MMSPESPIFIFPNLVGLWAVVAGLLTVIIDVAFACAVFRDADLLWQNERRKTFLVGGLVWALATLLGGVFVAGVYWIIHHSTLRAPSRPAVASPNPETDAVR
jgi:hypothetical protein